MVFQPTNLIHFTESACLDHCVPVPRLISILLTFKIFTFDFMNRCKLFIRLEICWTYWIYRLISFFSCRYFSAVISVIAPVPFSLLSFWDPSWICVISLFNCSIPDFSIIWSYNKCTCLTRFWNSLKEAQPKYVKTRKAIILMCIIKTVYNKLLQLWKGYS